MKPNGFILNSRIENLEGSTAIGSQYGYDKTQIGAYSTNKVVSKYNQSKQM